MKRKFTKMTAALALLVGLMIPLGMWGQSTVTFVAGTDTSSGTSITKDGITITFSNGTFSRTDNYRCYANATMSVSSTVGTITEVVLTCVQGNGPGNFSGDNNYTYDNLIGTWTNPGEGVLTASAQVRMTQIEVTYTPSGQTATYTVTYDCNGGTSGCPDNVTDIEAGTTIELADAPSRTDYNFNGWSDGANTYEAGDEYQVNSNVTFTAEWELDVDYLFYESFNDCNGTGGNDGQWSGSTIASSTLTADNEDWTFANGNGANKCAKFGTGSKLGSAQTPSITHTGNATLTFKAAAWNGNSENTTLKISATSGTLSASTVTLVKGAWTNYTIDITGISTSTQIKFEGNVASNSRFFLDEVMVVEAAPSTEPFITASNVEIAYNVTSGSIMAEIGNYVAGTMTAATEAEWITGFTYEQADEVCEIDFTAEVNTGDSREATVELTYTYGDNQTATKTVTVTQTGDPNQPGTENNPYTVAQAIAATPSTGQSDFVYVHGIVSEIVEAYSSQYHNISYNISDDGTTSGAQLEAFRGKGMNNQNFTSDQDILPGDIVTIYGKLTYYNQTTYELAQGNYLVAFERPASTEPSVTVNPAAINATANGEDGTLALSYENITDFISFDYYFCDAEGEELLDTDPDYPDWIDAEIQEEDDTYSLYYVIGANDGAARSAFIKVFTYDDELEEVYAIVTVNQEAYVAPFEGGTYTLATSIESGKTYIITSELFVDEIYAMGEDRGNNRGAVSVTIDGNTITVNPNQQVYEFVVTSLDEPQGFYSIYDPRNAGYLYAAGGTSSNYLKTKAELDNKGQWTITFGDNNEASIVANFGNEKANDPRNTMRFNATNNPPIFSCYASGQSDIYLYKKVETTPTGIQLEIEPGQWYLIASPVGTIEPTAVDDMTTSSYALYRFDQQGDADGKEWINYKNTTYGDFSLEEGKGYLYANQNGCTLTFTGTPIPFTDEDNRNVLELTYENTDLAGYNLLGNPFNETVYISGWPYYVMNEDGDAIIEGQGGIAPKQGFFVIAEGDDQSVNLSNEPTEKGASVALNVSRNRGNVIDRARVRFDESRQLPKFQLFENSTKVYIPQNGKDYAVVRSEGQGELPVNFRASENGTYTLSIDAENMDMNYLHLIDNMTGMDVDLLQTPSYTFEANVNDYESRFRLVFAGASTGSATDDSFAFYSNGSLIINNEGNATLQVVDLTGRILSSESVNGSVSTTLNAPTGVYMLRLINGDNVKVQKIVVR